MLVRRNILKPLSILGTRVRKCCAMLGSTFVVVQSCFDVNFVVNLKNWLYKIGTVSMCSHHMWMLGRSMKSWCSERNRVLVHLLTEKLLPLVLRQPSV